MEGDGRIAETNTAGTGVDWTLHPNRQATSEAGASTCRHKQRTLYMNNASNATEVMGRKAFNSFLYDLYGCKGKNDVKCDIDVACEGVYRIEVFNSPEGLIIAAHELDRVHVLRPSAVIGSSDLWANTNPDEDEEADFLEDGATPAPLSEPDFIDMTPEDEANIHKV
jgi:hypothetical protein